MSSLAAPSAHGRSRSKSPGRRDRDRDKSPRRRSRDKSPGRKERDKSPGRKERDKSPSRKERDKSPIRSRSPNPSPYPEEREGRKHRHEESKPAPTTSIVDMPEAPDAPPNVAMPQPHHGYAHTATPQFAPRQQSPPLGSHPSYAQPQHYQHAPPYANYADQDQYAYQQQERRASSPSKYSRPSDAPTLPPQEYPNYAPPGAYQYAPLADLSGKSPTSPRADSQQPQVNTAAPYPGNAGYGYPQAPAYGQGPPYASPVSPTYAQPQPYAYPETVPPQQSRRDSSEVHSPASYEARPRHGSRASPPGGREYAKPSPYQYAQPDERIRYTAKPQAKSKPSVEYVDKHREDANVIEIHPGGGSLGAPSSPGLGPRLHRLSVSGNHGGHGGSSTALTLTHAAPPGSPLLEAYHGTYQSISPMPSPIMAPHMDDSDLSDIMPLSARSGSPDDGDRRRAQKKRVKFYDPEDDAKELALALKHSRIDPAPLIDVLPSLTHDQMLQLRTEYKKHARVQGKGINIAKHIKVQLGNTAFAKACYATALGRWESEAYWANFWYQANTARRELLIESLMGRTNAEMRLIKDAFSDKRYGDSLERCMKAELKADKFRTAVLLALEERRQDDASGYVSDRAVRDDARHLHDALTAREGGETALIHIVVLRSDPHMRAVLQEYERAFGKNFAKDMLRKSTNLVGETLAHILNGIINRPVRDALLLHQALNETNKDALRNELLISRLVRYHWDRAHLERVKTEYRARYKRELATDVAESTRGDLAEFCIELCVRR
ncbi:MAG: hypothetical protein M1833_003142 [Piccolia ochrophora]|nr:MAG: hypothetical protein M1833_003142 [Piccolia ochrophora]